MKIGLIIKDNKLVIKTGPVIKNPITISFNLSKGFDKNIENEIDCIMKRNKPVADHAIENIIRQLLFNPNLGWHFRGFS